MNMLNNDRLHNRAESFIEALPYIKRFSGKICVVKCGGSAMNHDQEMENILQDIALLYFYGISTVVVHGGGPCISEHCGRLNLPVKFINGQRVTDQATLEIVQMVLLGKINPAIVSSLTRFGVKAVGISGYDSGLIKAEKSHMSDHLGFVGDIVSIDKSLIQTLLNNRLIPVIAPIGIDNFGQAYNINADVAAAAIAGSLGAEKLIMMSDVNGLYADLNNPDSQISVLKIEEAKSLLDENKISGGMIPKLESCLNALSHGVASAHILSGALAHGLLLEILTSHGIGTMIINEKGAV